MLELTSGDPLIAVSFFSSISGYFSKSTTTGELCLKSSGPDFDLPLFPKVHKATSFFELIRFIEQREVRVMQELLVCLFLHRGGGFVPLRAEGLQ